MSAIHADPRWDDEFELDLGPRVRAQLIAAAIVAAVLVTLALTWAIL